MDDLNDIWRSFRTDQGEQAFTALYRATEGLVWTLCWRVLRDEADARDAFQSTYTRLLLTARDPAASPQAADALALVGRLATLEAHALRKRRARMAAREADMEEHLEGLQSEATAGRDLAQAELRALLERLSDALDEDLRVPVQLHYFDGLTQRQVAEVLGLAVSSVNERLVRAQERLQRQLRRLGIRRPQDALPAVLPVAALLSAPGDLSAAAVYTKALSAANAGAVVATTVKAGVSGGAVAKLVAAFTAFLIVATALLMPTGSSEADSTVRVPVATPAQVGASAAPPTATVAVPPPAEPVAAVADPTAAEPAPAVAVAAPLIGGVIVDEVTGAPVVDALVVLFNAPDGDWRNQTYNRLSKAVSTTRTTATGGFGFAEVERRAYVLFVDSPTHRLIDDEAVMFHHVDLREEGDHASLRLEAWPGNVITGRVTDPRTRQPLAGVKVQEVNTTIPIIRQHYRRRNDVHSIRESATDSGPDGVYTLEHVFGTPRPVVSFNGMSVTGLAAWLTYTKDGYTGRHPFNPEKSEPSSPLPLSKQSPRLTLDIRLVPTVSTRIQVVDSLGSPIKGVRIHISRPVGFTHSGDQDRGVSDEEGLAALELPHGVHCHLSARADGYTPTEFQLRLVEPNTESPHRLVMQSTSNQRIRLEVVDEEGNPLGYRHIALEVEFSPGHWSPRHIGMSDPKTGLIEFADFDPKDAAAGKLRLVHQANAKFHRWERPVSAEDLTDPEPIPAVIRAIRAERLLTGRVFGPDEQPLAKALVFVPGTEFSAGTGTDGAYSIKVHPEATLLAVRHPEHGTSGIRTLRDDGPNDLHWKDANAIVEVHLYDANLKEPVTTFEVVTSEEWSQNFVRDEKRPHVFYVQQGYQAGWIKLTIKTATNPGAGAEIQIPEGRVLFQHDHYLLPMGDSVGKGYWGRVMLKGLLGKKGKE